MINQSPILITGCPRSGTSMVAGVFHICGAFAGITDKMYENIHVRDFWVKNYLRNIGMDVNGCYPLLNQYPVCLPEYWNEKISSDFICQGLSSTESWMYKDCRNALLWKLWNLSFPDAVWVIVRRKTEDIIESCKKTTYMGTFLKKDIYPQLGVQSVESAWQWVVDEYVFRFDKIINNVKTHFTIWPEKIAQGDFEEIKSVVVGLGLSWKDKEVKSYIQPRLYKHKQKEVL